MAPSHALAALLARSPKPLSLSPITSLAARTALSPMAIQDLHRRADENRSRYNPGNGARAPDAFNKTLFIVLFALIFMALVLTAIYFFCFARNGGFVWKETDWEDYKTTVLRRKGPDGKTLSNATKSTKLGGGSIVPKWADEPYSDVSGASEKSARPVDNGRSRQHWRDNREDPVFKDYAHERPAGVGGYNKPDDGSRYAPTNPSGSDVSAPKLSRKERKAQEKRNKAAQKESAAAAIKHAGPSDNSYQAQYRPGKPTMRAVSASVDASYNRTRHSTAHSSVSGAHSSTGDDESTGTKSYPCHIPGISRQPPPHASTPAAHTAHTADTPPAPPRHATPAAAPPSMTGTAAAAAAATAATASLFRGRGEVRPDESVSQVGAQQARRGYGGGFRRGRGQGAV